MSFVFLWPYLWHMEFPRLGVKWELQLPAYTTATRDRSRVCDLPHSSRQRQILNPLSEASDRTRILMDPSCVCSSRSHEGNSSSPLYVSKVWKPIHGLMSYVLLPGPRWRSQYVERTGLCVCVCVCVCPGNLEAPGPDLGRARLQLWGLSRHGHAAPS